MKDSNSKTAPTDVAIIGISCRFPGADNYTTFWENLLKGKESIQSFTKEELVREGVNEALLNNPNYIKARGILEEIDRFDASFFGFGVQDAKMLDPQQRIFLECAWEALESAGYCSEKFEGLIGVYASMADSLYLQNNLLKNAEFWQSYDWFHARIATSITTLSTQTSYRLNLTGPSINITTACSSSLVAVANACTALIDGDCDLAIAGAVNISVPQKNGYLYQKEGIESADGHCRPFDANGSGTVFGNGVGIVILKRLEDALKDRDEIYAVIKGWSINNDGADKVGFTAPSANGQAKCVASALAFADVEPESISYIEAHGTATALGDPIEIKALTKAFKTKIHKNQFCAIGSVKSNIGHLDIAAGMASIIKVALALKNKKLPSTLHFQKSNPAIDFPNTPFFVNDVCREWDFGSLPRRAGINASGIGGTNAFVVLEDILQNKKSSLNHRNQLLMLSAKTKTALNRMIKNLKDHLNTVKTESEFADIAYTLKVGRTDFNYRKIFVCEDLANAVNLLEFSSSEQLHASCYDPKVTRKIVFMFSGQGSQYLGMASDLYHSEPEFAKWINRCSDFLESDIKYLIQDIIIHKSKSLEINNTRIVQPALFVIEYSLAKYLISLGIKPEAMVGHSVGEYVAACLAEVISLEDSLKLICYRANLMASAPHGTMLAVVMSEEQVLALTQQYNISIAAVNGLESYVISGETALILEIAKQLEKQGILSRQLQTSHAFHSWMMEPILKPIQDFVKNIRLQAPKIPYVSNLTGNWITAEEATSAEYWAKHLRSTVKFYQNLEALIKEGYNTFIEVGPGTILSKLAKQVFDNSPGILVQNTLPGAQDIVKDHFSLLTLLGQLWLQGIKINWQAFYAAEERYRVPLPTYPFEKKRYWIEGNKSVESNSTAYKKLPYLKWFYEPSWERSSFCNSEVIREYVRLHKHCWILFMDSQGVAEEIAGILLSLDQQVVKVDYIEKNLNVFEKDNRYLIDIKNKIDYLNVIKSVTEKTSAPISIINLFSLTEEHNLEYYDSSEVHKTSFLGFYSNLFIFQSLIEMNVQANVDCIIVGNEIFSVTNSENIYPAKALVTGPCRVIPQEHPGFSLKVVDVLLSELKIPKKRQEVCLQIVYEIFIKESDNKKNILAYRDNYRWAQIFKPLSIESSSTLKLAAGGVYLFTGGLGGISLTIAQAIAKASKNPTFFLMVRSELPERSEWEKWLAAHDRNEPVSKKIIKLKELINMGANVIILKADISNYLETKEAIENIKKDFNQLCGVIHTAGVPGGGLVQLKTLEMASKVFAPKVEGTYILTHLLQTEPLQFFLLCSSVSAVIGELSQIDYCSANAVLDAFVYSKALKNTQLFTVVNWNTWRDIGMAVNTQRPEDVTYFDRNNDISPEEGANIFSDIIKNGFKQTLISTFDINTFIDLINENKDKDKEVSFDEEEALESGRDYVSPTTTTEIELAKIWQNVLGVHKIGVLETFTDLGGHSLNALRLLGKIENRFNVRLSLQTLQQANNIKKMALEIDKNIIDLNKQAPCLVTIRQAGTASPLFCLHPVAGNPMCYLPLAEYLDYDCPMYGLQDPSIHKGKLIFQSLEEMASNYAEAIQQVQPHGPYWLCGLSFGATLCIEIARQLRAKGETLKPLIFFDGWAKFSDEYNIEKLFKEALLTRNENKEIQEGFAEMGWDRMKLLLKYQSPMFQDKIILFKAITLLPEYKDIDHPLNHWDKYALGEVEVYKVYGDHETILQRPNVIYLAKKLDEILRKHSQEGKAL